MEDILASIRRILNEDEPAATPPAKPAAVAPVAGVASAAVPGAREMVSLRLDRAVLEHFQKDGPGWQDRINAALKSAAGL